MGEDSTHNELLSALSNAMPLKRTRFDLAARVSGLVIVDEVNGFAAPGGGNLAPPGYDAQVAQMVSETDRLARAFSDQDLPILAFLDTHEPGKPEPPYPPHCERGSGEEELVQELKWLEDDRHTTLVRKDCINGFVGATREDGSNQVVDWVNQHGIEAMLVVGICTDICVMDFVLTVLSARNHDMMPKLSDVVVYERGCATYDLPKQAALTLGLSESAAHPQNITHYMGFYFMAARGACIADRIELPA